MDDRSLMYRVYLKDCEWWIIIIEMWVLLIMHYLIQRMWVKAVLNVHVRDVKIKKFINPDVVIIHLLYKKKVNEKILVFVCTRRTYVPYETMIERMVGSTSSSNNV